MRQRTYLDNLLNLIPTQNLIVSTYHFPSYRNLLTLCMTKSCPILTYSFVSF